MSERTQPAFGEDLNAPAKGRDAQIAADGPGYFADNADCTWCSGEGEFWGSELPGYDPGWHDPDTLYPCPACRGTGNRRDQVLF